MSNILLARDRSCFGMFEENKERVTDMLFENMLATLPVISFTCKDKEMVDRTLRRCEHSIGSNSPCE